MGFKQNLFTIAVTVVVTLTAFPTLIGLAKLAETGYFPVLQPLTVTRSVRTSDEGVVIYGRVQKTRDCQFENVSFYKKTRFGDELVSAERLKPPKVESNPVGATVFGPWKVDVTKEELEAITTIKALHRCHPLYLTESIIYNGGKGQ